MEETEHTHTHPNAKKDVVMPNSEVSDSHSEDHSTFEKKKKRDSSFVEFADSHSIKTFIIASLELLKPRGDVQNQLSVQHTMGMT